MELLKKWVNDSGDNITDHGWRILRLLDINKTEYPSTQDIENYKSFFNSLIIKPPKSDNLVFNETILDEFVIKQGEFMRNTKEYSIRLYNMSVNILLKIKIKNILDGDIDYIDYIDDTEGIIEIIFIQKIEQNRGIARCSLYLLLLKLISDGYIGVNYLIYVNDPTPLDGISKKQLIKRYISMGFKYEKIGTKGNFHRLQSKVIELITALKQQCSFATNMMGGSNKKKRRSSKRKSLKRKSLKRKSLKRKSLKRKSSKKKSSRKRK